MFDFFIIARVVYSLLAIAVLVVVPVRRIFGLRDAITETYLDLLGKAILLASIIVSCGFAFEIWFVWYSRSYFELHSFQQRIWYCPYAWSYWILLATNSIVPLILCVRRVRRNDVALFLIALAIQCGIWIERIVIIHSLRELGPL